MDEYMSVILLNGSESDLVYALAACGWIKQSCESDDPKLVTFTRPAVMVIPTTLSPSIWIPVNDYPVTQEVVCVTLDEQQKAS